MSSTQTINVAAPSTPEGLRESHESRVDDAKTMHGSQPSLIKIWSIKLNMWASLVLRGILFIVAIRNINTNDL